MDSKESEKAAVCGLTSDIKPSSERQPLLLPSYNTEDKKVGDTIRVIPVYGDIYRDNTQTYPQATTIPPRDYLPISIFTAIFCCCTIGILAVYKSIRAREATQYGNYELARQYSRWALIYNCIAVVFGITTILIVTGLSVLLYCESCFDG